MTRKELNEEYGAGLLPFLALFAHDGTFTWCDQHPVSETCRRMSAGLHGSKLWKVIKEEDATRWWDDHKRTRTTYQLTAKGEKVMAQMDAVTRAERRAATK